MLVSSICGATILGYKRDYSLVSIIAIPLYIPLLIFSAGAIQNFNEGFLSQGFLLNLALLVAILLLYVPTMLFFSSILVKYSIED